MILFAQKVVFIHKNIDIYTLAKTTKAGLGVLAVTRLILPLHSSLPLSALSYSTTAGISDLRETTQRKGNSKLFELPPEMNKQ